MRKYHYNYNGTFLTGAHQSRSSCLIYVIKFVQVISCNLPNYITADDVETMVLDPRKAVNLESGWHLNGSVFMMIWGKLFKKS
ncbi:hypothetical protein ACSFSO_08660, partial [Limosilactobacillus fermentum]